MNILWPPDEGVSLGTLYPPKAGLYRSVQKCYNLRDIKLGRRDGFSRA